MPRLFRATARWPLPDFVVHPTRPPALAWAALLCAGVVFAFVADEGMDLMARRGEVAAERTRLELLAPPALRVTDTVMKTTPAAVREADAIARRLRHPWQAGFEATERSVASGVRWLRLAADAERGEWRLGGEAQDREAIRATLDTLAGATSLHEVMLVRVELAPAPAVGLRFELQARQVAAR